MLKVDSDILNTIKLRKFTLLSRCHHIDQSHSCSHCLDGTRVARQLSARFKWSDSYSDVLVFKLYLLLTRTNQFDKFDKYYKWFICCVDDRGMWETSKCKASLKIRTRGRVRFLTTDKIIERVCEYHQCHTRNCAPENCTYA